MGTVKVGMLCVAFVTAVVSASAEAAPLVGSFSASGSFKPASGASATAAALESATALDFLTGTKRTPGVPGTLITVASTGDFTTVSPLGSVGTIADFAFSGPGSSAFPVAPIVSFESLASGLSVDLLSVALGPTAQTSKTIDLMGTVLFHAPGFDPTPGLFILSGSTTSGVTFGFSTTQSASVPEPALASLLGAGLAAVGWRRRMASAPIAR